MSWYSAAALAELKLSGLPDTTRGIQKLAEAEGWYAAVSADGEPLARARKGRGGGREYHVNVLPSIARAALQARIENAEREAPVAANKGSSEAWAAYQRATDKQRSKAAERVAILDEVLALEAGGSTRTAAVQTVSKRHSIGSRSVFEWLNFIKGVPRNEWVWFLVPRHKGRTARAEFTEDAWDMVVALYLTRSAQPLAEVYRTVCEAADAHGWMVPSYAAVKKRIETDIPAQTVERARKGETAFKELRPAERRNKLVFASMEAVNADGHVFDVQVRWEDGFEGRPVLVGYQDIRSGKMLSWRLDRTENTDTVRMAFGDLIERHGIPKHVYLDNGRAFASKEMTGGMTTRYRFKVNKDECEGLFKIMGTEPHWVKPASGQSKPVERAWRDLCDTISKHPLCVGAYVGNSPTNRPDNIARKNPKRVPIAEFKALVDHQIERHNARPARRTQACRGKLSFDQAFEEGMVEGMIEPASPENVWMCRTASAQVFARKKGGGIYFKDNAYWSPELVRWAGKHVVIRFDADDLHKPVFVYDKTGRFICEAECVANNGFNTSQDARDNGRRKAARDKLEKRERDALQRLTPEQAIALAPTPSNNTRKVADVITGKFPEAPKRPAHKSREISEETLDRIISMEAFEAHKLRKRRVSGE